MLRIPGHAEIFLHTLMAPVTNTDLSFHTQYMISEIVVAIIMALGLWCLFATQPRPPGLIVMLPLLSLAIFPQQGLHFLIPGTLALSFGMAAWGLVLMRRSRPALLFGAGVLSMASHPIGLVHAAIAGFLILLRFALRQIALRRAILEAVALLLVLAIFAFLSVYGLTLSPKIGNVVSISLFNLSYNLEGIGKQLIYSAVETKVETFFVLAGAVAMAIHWRDYSAHGMLVLLLIAMILLSCVYTLEGYPGEAAFRLLIPILLILFCHALALPVPQKMKASWQPLALALLASLLCMEAVNYVYKQKDGGLPNVKRPELVKALGRMKGDEHIVYVNTDIALQTALLAGGETHVTSAWGLLNADPQAARNWFADNPPDFLAAAYPDELLTIRGRERSLLSVRPYGFRMDDQSSLQLKFPKPVKTLWLKLHGDGSSVSAFSGATRCATDDVSGGQNGWAKLDLSACEQPDSSILLRGDAWIVGLARKEPVPRLNWPWGEQITWTYSRNRSFGRKSINREGGFSFHQIDKRFNSEVVSPWVARLEPYDDISGVIFWRIRKAG